MNEMRKAELFVECFTLKTDLILIVTNLSFVFFDDDLEVLKIMPVNSACSLGKTITASKPSLRESEDS